jgi:hypothetical protein
MRGLNSPSENRAAQVIEMCCENGAARVALDLAERWGVGQGDEVRVAVGTWVDILRVSAEAHYVGSQLFPVCNSCYLLFFSGERRCKVLKQLGND